MRELKILNKHVSTRREARGKVRSVSHISETPFDNIENSHQYVSMLAEAIEEARQEVDAEIALAAQERAGRRTEALQVVAYNLAKLSVHITTSGRILNDLRSLRRLLLAEREAPAEKAQPVPVKVRSAHG
jgi:hypothetical protein